jgi:hypothetical protein
MGDRKRRGGARVRKTVESSLLRISLTPQARLTRISGKDQHLKSVGLQASDCGFDAFISITSVSNRSSLPAAGLFIPL